MEKNISRVRRRAEHHGKQVRHIGSRSEDLFETYLFKRFHRLRPVRRFVIGWVALLCLLITASVIQNVSLSSYYQTVKAVPGGIYTEGILGSFSNANPLYASSDADSTVSRLVFASLFKHDSNGDLVGDLASDYTVDARGTTYTVNLRPGLTWHDGKPLTSKDVVFTYQSIQNADAASPLQSSWQGIEVSAANDRTVIFKLPDPLAAFANNMTNGIIPEHILGKVAAADLRSADFNSVRPIGSGPFAWQTIEIEDREAGKAEQQIALVPFDKYHAGRPKLNEFIVHTYADKDVLIDALKSRQLTAAEGLTDEPEKLRDNSSIQVNSMLLKAANMVFFKTSTGVLADQKVRQSLIQAADVPAITKQLSYPTKIVNSPLLSGQLAYDSSLKQAGYNLKAAQAKLDGDGWVKKNGLYRKNGQPLTFTLVAADTAENRYVTEQLKKQWKALGADLKVTLQNTADLQTSLTYHNYDALLHGITIGTDPDVFVYWASSQSDVRASNRLNFSEYNSRAADNALEAGRTRQDPALRAVKYRPFLQAWQQDAPALGLYQPRLLYLTNGSVDGLSDAAITTPIDRFANVQNWQIRQAKVTNE